MHIIVVFCAVITLTFGDSDFSFSEDEKILDNNVAIKTSPPYLVRGLNFTVDIECKVRKVDLPSMASVFSMVIAHSHSTDHPLYFYVASVDALEGHSHNISHEAEVISGSIDNNGESILHIRFKFPESNLTGKYMCEVFGFDHIGKPVTKYSTVEVLPTDIGLLFDLIKESQSNITTLQDLVNKANSCLSEKQSFIETLTHGLVKNDFYSPLLFNEHHYYLRKPTNHFSYSEAQTVCEEFGGYLLELDSHPEYIFIVNYITTMNIDVLIYTGMTDEEKEGVWVNKHSPNMTATIIWGVGEPSGGTLENCLCFKLTPQWSMIDIVCVLTRNPLINYDLSLICEVPEAQCRWMP
uniref:C-type lectin domain-containing protein n=1 Tax=Biomphalaria glabrata TaxID=6526 RepID=A0A2C9LS89_BIOGL